MHFLFPFLQDVSFAGFDRKTLSQSCLLMKAWCDSILSIFQPLINYSDSDWFPPSWFRIIIIISCPPFLQKVMIERDSPCKKKHMRSAFRRRKASGSNFFAVGVCERFIAIMGEAKKLRSCVVFVAFFKKGHEGVDSTSRSDDK